MISPLNGTTQVLECRQNQVILFSKGWKWNANEKISEMISRNSSNQIEGFWKTIFVNVQVSIIFKWKMCHIFSLICDGAKCWNPQQAQPQHGAMARWFHKKVDERHCHMEEQHSLERLHHTKPSVVDFVQPTSYRRKHWLTLNKYYSPIIVIILYAIPSSYSI